MRELLQPLVTLPYRVLAVRRVLLVQNGLDLAQLVVDLSGGLAVKVAVVDGVHGGAVAHDSCARPARVALLVPVGRALGRLTVGRAVVGHWVLVIGATAQRWVTAI